ncbi:hypothetical protein C8R47DRAFT_258561 [Mycena vitilis]|nr:hypothetical protein C8R47DRAFT_258561 [Mycena vitilis]
MNTPAHPFSGPCLQPTESTMTSFPQELIDSIIDYVEELDLTQCSLVSSSWLPRAQSRIFCTISLGVGIQGGFPCGLIDIPSSDPADENFTRFRDLLRKSPHLSSYVRGLNLGLPPLASEQPAESPWSDVLSPASWQSIEDTVVEFVPLLCHLESLGLFPCGDLGRHTFHLRSRIVEVFRSLSLRSLAFSGWVFRDPLALHPFESHPPSSLRFIQCRCKAPLLPVKQDLAFLELDDCAGFETFPCCPRIDSVTLHVSGWGPPPSLSWIAPSLSRSLAIAFHSDSPAFIGIGLLEDISLKHIQHLDILFLEQYKPNWQWLEPFFTSFFTSVVLNPGATLHVAFSGSFLSVPSWNAGWHSRFDLNPALHFRNPGTFGQLDDNEIVDYDFVWVA